MKDTANRADFMNMRFYQMLTLENGEHAYLTQKNQQFSLVILIKNNQVSQIYGDNWSDDPKDKLTMEGMLPHIISDGKYTEIY
ncbi:hypothetical protein MFLO_07702 [Listeria floridensis FSL S10-1187]|uniref:Uncharacterized protein n=2 Tax=Listeria floridensis TaxID=1494962 RepID=A0ABN0RFQ0_9LIST|nr:hypothetical protein MFLO_07702 [Listeria floridensis FSL S10-1187]